MKYHIKTFGCQMNISDSERIASFLESQKIKPTEEITKADLVIFNTCGIRQMAEDRVYGQIHNIRKQESMINDQQKKKTIILTGCLANRKDVQRRLKNKVDLFCEIKDFQKEFRNWIIGNYLEIGNWKLEIPAQQKNTPCSDYLSINPKYNNSHSAFVPVMTGCNNFCSYCVVPYARGREVSRPSKEIIMEIKNLLKNGCKEIILLGQNVNSYQHMPSPQPSPDYGRGGNSNPSPPLGEMSRTRDREGDVVNFPKLLQLIEKIPGHFWISFMSSHPKDFSSELIETIAKSKKICEHIHLPLQAGDDKILLAMNRKYTAKKYLNLVAKIKSAFAKYKPNKLYSITTDIIVGFPGETKKQFLESACVMKKVGYDLVYFGQFSPRPGTVAFKMKDNVSKIEKKKREFFLNEILKETALGNNQKYLGKILEVLIDKKEGANYFGRTHSLKNVKIISTQKNLVGKFVKVKITKANIWNLEASLYIKP
ncbi:MAG: (Dimethylallyl)adenosine tRNA methylthiotransferase MiaB [Candidatus Moranbacteria bacterium GW2011_GWF2_36_839]|nr:MAG: (Dimethylallyl)adenosine tRNA methylthiotransferase MiaB [Candidatus Moranbacteria bacterium GW2011_GWF1_36_78]KKQ17573.1 MAG: (Dimethylallyl)adenosine tRNA methylthiotransferase MiaB [Candidatus Moranbacteria bacterium GW2011_GWF2_36_839]HAT74298.1 tRNA (N6-isopentenyl adenosine(37)-C2)-methylthiotransferase MiaB [Candidatus Moranbacteria bacterium]HBY10923.1 tRNA (N6-isopentenyl adenosine(37)-C2)-methylthiotransferase MiaB [Candidatus Moranbacteria bacterium]